MRRKCDCEHADHFHDQAHHQYGEVQDNIIKLPTRFRVFNICKDCIKAKHMQYLTIDPEEWRVRGKQPRVIPTREELSAEALILAILNGRQLQESVDEALAWDSPMPYNDVLTRAKSDSWNYWKELNAPRPANMPGFMHSVGAVMTLAPGGKELGVVGKGLAQRGSGVLKHIKGALHMIRGTHYQRFATDESGEANAYGKTLKS